MRTLAISQLLTVVTLALVLTFGAAPLSPFGASAASVGRNMCISACKAQYQVCLSMAPPGSESSAAYRNNVKQCKQRLTDCRYGC